MLLPSLMSLTTRQVRLPGKSDGEITEVVVPQAVAMLINLCTDELSRKLPTAATLGLTAGVLEAISALLSEPSQGERLVHVELHVHV